MTCWDCQNRTKRRLERRPQSYHQHKLTMAQYVGLEYDSRSAFVMETRVALTEAMVPRDMIAITTLMRRAITRPYKKSSHELQQYLEQQQNNYYQQQPVIQTIMARTEPAWVCCCCLEVGDKRVREKRERCPKDVIPQELRLSPKPATNLHRISSEP